MSIADLVTGIKFDEPLEDIPQRALKAQYRFSIAAVIGFIVCCFGGGLIGLGLVGTHSDSPKTLIFGCFCHLLGVVAIMGGKICYLIRVSALRILWDAKTRSQMELNKMRAEDL